MERIPGSERTREKLKAVMEVVARWGTGVRSWCGWRRG
jgi:hypothetical protein